MNYLSEVRDTDVYDLVIDTGGEQPHSVWGPILIPHKLYYAFLRLDAQPRGWAGKQAKDLLKSFDQFLERSSMIENIEDRRRVELIIMDFQVGSRTHPETEVRVL